MSNTPATEATRKLTKPEGPLGDGGPPASLLGKVYARCYDQAMARIVRPHIVGCAERPAA